MLEALGIKDVTGDGMRDLPDGQSFHPESFVATGTVKTGELMKEYLRAVSIDLQIKSVDQWTHDQSVATGSYNIALVGYGTWAAALTGCGSGCGRRSSRGRSSGCRASTTPGSRSWRPRS